MQAFAIEYPELLAIVAASLRPRDAHSLTRALPGVYRVDHAAHFATMLSSLHQIATMPYTAITPSHYCHRFEYLSEGGSRGFTRIGPLTVSCSRRVDARGHECVCTDNPRAFDYESGFNVVRFANGFVISAWVESYPNGKLSYFDYTSYRLRNFGTQYPRMCGVSATFGLIFQCSDIKRVILHYVSARDLASLTFTSRGMYGCTYYQLGCRRVYDWI